MSKSYFVSLRGTIALALLATLAAGICPLRAGDNTEEVNVPLNILFDKYWDKRFYDGTAGFPAAIPWHYDDGNRPEAVSSTDFTNAVQAAFDTWSAINSDLSVDPTVPQPLIPVAAFDPTPVDIPVDPTDMMKIGTIDGINAFTWENGGAFFGTVGGVLAGTVSTVMIEDSAPTTDPSVPGGTGSPTGSDLDIGFPTLLNLPIPVGTILPRGTIIDADIGTDAADDWRFKADTNDPNPVTNPGLDVQSVETHEIGHFWGLSHTIMGIVLTTNSPDIAASDDDATMVPSIDVTTALRTLRYEDKASAIRTYTRNNGLAQNPAGLASIIGRVVRDFNPGTDAGPDTGPCSVAATGVSVRVRPINTSALSSSPYEFEDMSFAMGPGGGGPKPESKCSDGKDNDKDGDTDCADGDCDGDPVCAGCTPNETPEMTCDDTADNDCDGDTDCDDSDCAGDPACTTCMPVPEICTNLIDDDCDGNTDCDDGDCAGDPACLIPCGDDGSCDVGENCEDCPMDCVDYFCGNGLCEPGEDCTNCSDCRGKQNGKPANRYCCFGGTSGAGEIPVDCNDSRCTAEGFDCNSAIMCATPGIFPDGPDGVDTFSDSEFRSPSLTDGSFALNVPPGDGYTLDIFTYDYVNPGGIFWVERYNFTAINTNTVNFPDFFFCTSPALFFPFEHITPILSPGQVYDAGDVCVQVTNQFCTLGDPTP